MSVNDNVAVFYGDTPAGIVGRVLKLWPNGLVQIQLEFSGTIVNAHPQNVRRV
jgi:hypothetical protein